MHHRFVFITGVAAALVGCDRSATEVPDLVERNAVYTIEDGRVVRIPAYRGETPVLGQCVEPLTYGLAAGGCALADDRRTTAKPIEPRILDRQGFRSSARLISVEAGVEADVSGQKAKVKTTVARHRLFLEWNRYALYSLDPLSLDRAGQGGANPAGPYVSGVEYGVGVRIILDVSLTDVDAETNLTFGFGSMAAQVALGDARIAVQYDTIGVPRDILPEDLPIAIESVGDITRMMVGLYGAVTEISRTWNAQVERRQGGDARVAVAPGPVEAGATGPEGTGAGVLDAAPALPAARLKPLVGEVERARKALGQLSARDSDLGALFEKGQPIVGGEGFAALAGKVGRGEDVSASEFEALLESLGKHRETLEKIAPSLRDAKLRELPESLREPAIVTLVLSAYYPLLRGDEETLYPRGFSAAPIAYYVTRRPNDVRRDYCEELRLSAAAKRKAPDEGARERCAEHWKWRDEPPSRKAPTRPPPRGDSAGASAGEDDERE